jgi:Fic family protein
MNHSPLAQQPPPDLSQRVLMEFRELPTLCLTVAQAARLWQVDAATAAAALDELTRHGYLRCVGSRFCNSGSELVSLGC